MNQSPEPPIPASRPRRRTRWIVATLAIVASLITVVGATIYAVLSQQVSDAEVVQRAAEASRHIKQYRADFKSEVRGYQTTGGGAKKLELDFTAQVDSESRLANATYTTSSTGRIPLKGEMRYTNGAFYQQILAPTKARRGWQQRTFSDKEPPVVTNITTASLAMKDILANRASAITKVQRYDDRYELILSSDDTSVVKQVLMQLVGNQVVIQGLHRNDEQAHRDFAVERFDVRIVLNKDYQPIELKADIELTGEDDDQTIRVGLNQRVTLTELNQPVTVEEPRTGTNNDQMAQPV